MTEIRLPQIDSDTEAGQLIQVRSYLYQLAEQLNLAFGRIENDEKTANITYGSQAVSQSASAVEKAQAANTFNSIKGLIIKSADVVETLSEEITKTLNGQYVAQSEYGTFKETTQATLNANSRAFEIKFSNNSEIDADSNNIEYTMVKASDAWAKVGILDSDEATGYYVYGMEIGQINATTDANGNIVDVERKSARYTTDGIELYDGLTDEDGKEIPSVVINGEYMSIKRMKVGKSIELGGYIIDVERNDGIVFKWVEV